MSAKPDKKPGYISRASWEIFKSMKVNDKTFSEEVVTAFREPAKILLSTAREQQ